MHKPNQWTETSTEEKAFCKKLFRDNLTHFLDIFKRAPTLYAIRQMWRWARIDAFTTFNKE